MNTYSPESEIVHLKREVEELRDKILSLRAGRRILMDLLTLQTRDAAHRLQTLERENQKLRQRKLSVVYTRGTKDSLRIPASRSDGF